MHSDLILGYLRTASSGIENDQWMSLRRWLPYRGHTPNAARWKTCLERHTRDITVEYLLPLFFWPRWGYSKMRGIAA